MPAGLQRGLIAVLAVAAALAVGSAWVYYGPQRTVVGDLPVWTPFTYVSFLFVIAAGVHTLAERLPTRWHWTNVPAVPALLATAHVTASLPSAVALYRTDNPTLVLAGALASMATAALIAASLARMSIVSRRFGCGAVRGDQQMDGAAGQSSCAGARVHRGAEDYDTQLFQP